MKRHSRKLSSGETAVMAVLMLCMVLAVAIAGFRMAAGEKDDGEDQFVELEEIDSSSELAANEEQDYDSRKTTGESMVNEGIPDKFIADSPEEERDLIAAEDQADVMLDESLLEENSAKVEVDADASGEESAAAGTSAEETTAVSGTAAIPVQEAAVLNFQEEDTLAWPVNGNVVLDYSMDSTIYFPTLKQYKYNPAIVISQEAGTPVEAAADGRITSIAVDAETGTTVTMDLGGGYTAIYGQLKEVPVSEGCLVSKQDVIGYVSEPTKYYSVEGSNLYFCLKKNGSAVDPLDYLE